MVLCFLVLVWPFSVCGSLGRLQGSLGLSFLTCKMNITIPVLPSSQCYHEDQIFFTWDYSKSMQVTPVLWFRKQEKSEWTQGPESCGTPPLNQNVLLELARKSTSVLPGTTSVLIEVSQGLHCQYQQDTRSIRKKFSGYETDLFLLWNSLAAAQQQIKLQVTIPVKHVLCIALLLWGG